MTLTGTLDSTTHLPRVCHGIAETGFNRECARGIVSHSLRAPCQGGRPSPRLQQGGGPIELGAVPDYLTPFRPLARQLSPGATPRHSRLYNHRGRL